MGLIQLQVAVRLVTKLRFTLGWARRGMEMMKCDNPFARDPFAPWSQFWFNQFDWDGPMRLVDKCLAAMGAGGPGGRQ